MKTCNEYRNSCQSLNCPLINSDRLRVEELELLVRCTIAGKFGDGITRQYHLKRWYPIVQGLLNYEYGRHK